MSVETDLAWAAGFLDGEGCFTLLKHSKGTHESQRGLHVSASQNRREPCDKLCGLFGGRVGETKQTHSGNAIFMWRLSEARAIEFMIELVLPYLVVKRREAEIVSAFAATVRRRGRPKRDVSAFTSQEEIATRMRLIDELDTIRGRSAAEVVMLG